MQDFWLYFQLGHQHIADWKAYDHILFVTALCLRYLLSDWKKVLVLVTAFTIGHSITLALSVLDYIVLPVKWVEFLIPLTIILTALNNTRQKDPPVRKKLPLIYFFALFFGLIHGLGFSYYLKSLLGKETSIINELLAFNLGLEFGQIMIVAIALILSWIIVRGCKISRRDYILFLSGGIFGIALIMAIERFPS